MQMLAKFFRAVAFSGAKLGLKKAAYVAGAQVGLGTLSENAVEVGLQFIEEICKELGGSQREAAARLPIGGALDPEAQRELRAAVAEIAQASGEQLQTSMEAAIDELAPSLPQPQRDALLAGREQLKAYAAMLPDRIRRTLQRAEDPTGRTLPDALQIRTPLDLARLLPSMPRFRPGDMPIYNRRLVRVLGVGTFGEVWEATKVGFDNRRVALKFCLGDDAALIHEARIAQRLEHPGIVQLLEIHPCANHPQYGDVPVCLEYEFVAGPDLAAWWLSRRLSDADRPAATAELIAQLAEIVQVAHGHRGPRGAAEPIVHRDLKPGNVLVARTARGYQLKITDFGIGVILRAAEQAGEATLHRTLAQHGSSYTVNALGSHTPGYAPHEQIAGAPADPRNDVHALGVIWYQMLRRDFSAPNPSGPSWKRKLRTEGVSDAHLELIESCLDSEMGERPRDGAALADAIRALGATSPEPFVAPENRSISAAPDPAPPRIVVPATPKVVVPAKKELIEATFPMTAEQARAVQGAAAKALGLPVMETLDIGNGVKLDMMLIPAGEFMMGSPSSEAERYEDEGPQHRVRISKPFRVGKFQVTQAQWRAVMGNNPSHFQAKADSSGVLQSIARAFSGSTPPKPADFGNHPVERVSWDDCKEFCVNLSRQLGREIQLLTEAQWEYACRAGTVTPFHFGPTISTNQANYDGNHTYANGSKGEYRQKTTPVGSFPANGWGLHDMHGNVWEWCASWFGPYEAGDKVDPTDSGSGTDRVLRGGSWFNLPRHCRSAYRCRGTPDYRNNSIGFRVASGTE